MYVNTKTGITVWLDSAILRKYVYFFHANGLSFYKYNVQWPYSERRSFRICKGPFPKQKCFIH